MEWNYNIMRFGPNFKRGCNINDLNKHGSTPLLHLLQKDCNLESVQALIELGADCKVTNSASISPSSLAYSKQIVNIVHMMIERGADINVTDRSLSTPLFYAVERGSTVKVDVVHSLLLAGANPNFTDIGMSPLHIVSSYGRHDLAKMLLCFGARVDQVNSEGNTPLHEAIQAKTGDKYQVCSVLINAGPNVVAMNYNNSTPFMMMEHSWWSPFKLIIGHVVLLIHTKGYSLASKERDVLNSTNPYSRHYDDCFSCVSGMRTLNLGNSHITLLDFLCASQRQAHRYIRNEQILEDLRFSGV